MTGATRVAIVAGALALRGMLAPLEPLAVRAHTPAASPPQGQVPRPVFRATADLVTIPVFVKGDTETVAALTADDFVLTDNGVRQAVEMIDSEALPVDVTVLVETSRALVDYASDVAEQVRRIAAMVRPADRLEVLGVADYVTVLLPFGPADRAVSLPRQPSEGLSAINDALVAALARRSDPDRQHLVIAVTDSIDTMSTVDVDTVREVARQSNATLVVSWITLSEDDGSDIRGAPYWMTSQERLTRHVRGPAQRRVPRRQTWTPHVDPPQPRTIYAFDALKEAAELTGGGLYPPGIFFNRNASVIFEKVYADFRRNVVLRYRPEGVERVGWHDVTVTIPAHPGLEVRPRRGYFVEAAPPTVAVPDPDPGEAPRPGALGTLLAAVATGDLDRVHAALATAGDGDALASLIEAFAASGNRWPADPHREFVVALALAGAAAGSSRNEVRTAGLNFLEGYEPLVRAPLGPDEYERFWLLAEAAILQGAMRPAEALPRIRSALVRFPDEPRLRLARAVLADQLTIATASAGGPQPEPPAVTQALNYYDAVSGDPRTTAEARLRKAWLLRRVGRNAEATAMLDRLSPGDPVLSAWRNLVTTHRVEDAMSGPEWETYWRADYRSMREALASLWTR